MLIFDVTLEWEEEMQKCLNKFIDIDFIFPKILHFFREEVNFTKFF